MKNTLRAKPFRAVRKQHKSEMAEDYTELIADLIADTGQARIGQIAKQLGVSHVTVIRTLQRLHKAGYVKVAPQQPVILTAAGAKMARHAKNRHRLLLNFLMFLGVPKIIAEQDVEGIEHHISSISLQAINTHMKTLKEAKPSNLATH